MRSEYRARSQCSACFLRSSRGGEVPVTVVAKEVVAKETGPELVAEPQTSVIAEPGPVLALPLSFPRGPRPPLWAIAVTASAAGLIASAFASPWSPWAGLVVGPLAGLVLLVRRARLFLSLSAVGLVVATGVYVTMGQAHNHYPVGAAWPSNFEPATVMASLAVLLLGADALVERVRSSPAGDQGDQGDQGDE